MYTPPPRLITKISDGETTQVIINSISSKTDWVVAAHIQVYLPSNLTKAFDNSPRAPCEVISRKHSSLFGKKFSYSNMSQQMDKDMLGIRLAHDKIVSDRRIDVKMHCSIPSILPAFNALFIYKKRAKITGLSNAFCASF